MEKVSSCRSEDLAERSLVMGAHRGNAGNDRGCTASGSALGCDRPYDIKKRLPFLPAPSQPRKYRTVRAAVRAAKLRKALAFGPLTRAQAQSMMQCSRFALSNTLKTMPDVRIVRGVVTRAAA